MMQPCVHTPLLSQGGHWGWTWSHKRSEAGLQYVFVTQTMETSDLRPQQTVYNPAEAQTELGVGGEFTLS